MDKPVERFLNNKIVTKQIVWKAINPCNHFCVQSIFINPVYKYVCIYVVYVLYPSVIYTLIFNLVHTYTPHFFHIDILYTIPEMNKNLQHQEIHMFFQNIDQKMNFVYFFVLFEQYLEYVV